MIAEVRTRVDSSLDAPIVHIQAHIARGLPAFSVVGLPNTSVKESKDRVRSAIISSNFKFPEGRITVNLTPANTPKSGGRYDLGIALSILIASGQIVPSVDITMLEFYGELGLDGKIAAVNGLFPSIVQAENARHTSIIPPSKDPNLSLLSQETMRTAAHLLEVAAYLQGSTELAGITLPEQKHTSLSTDFSDIKGQHLAKRALEIAASGGHNVLLSGTPGAGKTMLSERFTAITPELTLAQLIEVAAMHSLAGIEHPLQTKVKVVRSPHHSSSNVAIIGGGSTPKPGEVSLAHHGVLFLDELPEFNKNVLETLRQPLESGEVHISRIKEQVTFPARFQLIAAMNPCKCGYFGDQSNKCHCTLEQVENYQSKISGPLLDRIDIKITVQPVEKKALLHTDTTAEDSATIKARVVNAYNIQMGRQGKQNAHLSTKEVDKYIPLTTEQKELLANAIDKLNLSARSYTKVLKVARTIADLAGSDMVQNKHLTEALNLQRN